MTELQLANIALGKIGSQPVVALDEGSRNSDAVQKHYELIRNETLRLFDWPRIIKRSYLADTSDIAWTADTAYSVNDYCTNNGYLYVCTTGGTSAAADGPSGTTEAITDGTVTWKYLEALPANLTDYAYQYVIPADSLFIDGLKGSPDYSLEGLYIYTDTGDAVVIYQKRETDPSRWDELLQGLVIARLAWVLARELAVKGEVVNEVRQEYMLLIARARTRALREARQKSDTRPYWSRTSVITTKPEE